MKNKLIGLDTNIFIYHFQNNPQFGQKAQKIFSQLTTNKTKAITSVITLTELLSLKRSDEIILELKNLMLELPNMEIKDISRDIAIEAARIRRTYGYRLPDSIQVATALAGKADMFITNDVKLQSFKEIKIVLLQNLPKYKRPPSL